MIKNNYEVYINENIIDVKNYLKISDINCNYIVIMFKNKSMKINGNNLIINKMDEFELSIVGNYKSIEFFDE